MGRWRHLFALMRHAPLTRPSPSLLASPRGVLSLPLLSLPVALFSPRPLALLILFLLSAPLALGVGIGVNKGTLSFEEVLQQGYAQDEFLVTTDSEEEITGIWQVEGELAPWIRLDPPDETFRFSSVKPYRMTVIIEPPADAQLRSYEGRLRILTSEIARSEGGQIGTSTRAAFLIRIRLGVSGTQRIECRAGGIQVKSTEVSQASELVATVTNKGNVRISPEFVVEIYDQYQEQLLKSITIPGEAEILPTVTREYLEEVAHGLPVGQYWARVSVPLCGDSSLVTFDVLDRGGIADQGELLRVEASPWAETGEIIPIYAVFRNLGSRTVSAKFKGTVTTQQEARIVKVIDTDSYNVPPGETARIETFFNPTEPGKYIVAGRVLYNNKLTFQKSTIINVRGSVLRAAGSWNWAIILIIVILLLLILIAKKRRAQRRPRYR